MNKKIDPECVQERIFIVRGRKVLLDMDIAALYGVETGALNRAVKRNRSRFPEDFMFQLSHGELDPLKCHFGISKGGRRYLPYAFTEQGVAMLSGILHSPKAVQVNIAIMRAFVKLRKFLSTHKELAEKLAELETKVSKHDGDIHSVFDAIKRLIEASASQQKKIGFAR